MTGHTENKGRGRIYWQYADSHPVMVFVLITFAWTWTFWLAVIPISARDQSLFIVMLFIGAYGPAIGGILTLTLRNGPTKELSRQRTIALACVASIIFMVLLLRYLSGSIPHYDALPDNPTLTFPVIALSLVVCLIGAWVISSAYSEQSQVRERMASLLPSSPSLGWLTFAILFFPALFFVSWAIRIPLGLKTWQPPLWDRPPVEAAGLFLLTFLMTATMRGGLEEPGWRGFLLPELQKRFNPLVASLIIAVIWDLWHIPLFINKFFSTGVVAGMAGLSPFIIALAIFFTWVYNKSKGNLLVLVLLHTSFNVAWAIVPGEHWTALAIGTILLIVIVLRDKMYLRPQGNGGNRGQPRMAVP
ncbi:MAG: CPBP family intramembrane glutamic endopeptidase [Planctomycetota bacterium]|jgi:membrane protease YdiL (CAAX protease family)